MKMYFFPFLVVCICVPGNNTSIYIFGSEGQHCFYHNFLNYYDNCIAGSHNVNLEVAPMIKIEET